MKKLFLSMILALVAVLGVRAAVNVNEVKGWYEGGYVTWTPMAEATAYNVYVAPAASDSWTKLDNELVRNYGSYGRADMVGLKAGDYKFKVVPVIAGAESTADATVTSAFTAVAYDRAGFAHQDWNEGVGAYNNDGTLKDGAKVIYVYANNAKTVKAKILYDKTETEFTGLQAICKALEKGTEKAPVCIRIIGTIKAADMDSFGSSEEGLQIKGKNGSVKMNITVEGIGSDATLHGFGILARNVLSGEFRNFASMICMDDCLSLDTDNHHIWIHNMDFFYGGTGSDADQAKGDGTVDIKGKSSHITLSYNHFWDSGKCSLGGMKSETTDCVLTYHHNWFDHSDSRHPRIRTMSFHIYNNYFDGNAKYGVGMTMGGSAFVEKNLFRNCKYPMLISKQGTDATGDGTFSGEAGGVIKSFGNTITACKRFNMWSDKAGNDWDAYEVKSADEQVPASVTCASGGTTYNNFDTNGTLKYAYTCDPVDELKAKITGELGAGRVDHGDFKWQFNNATQDENYDVISALKTELLNYKSALVGFYGDDLPASVSNGGYKEGDRSGGDPYKNEDYVPSYGGGGGTGGGGGDEMKELSIFLGTEDGDFYLFNAANQATTEQLLANGTIVMNDGSKHSTVAPADDADAWGLNIAKSTGTMTIYNEKGIGYVSYSLYRTGSMKGSIKGGDDLSSLSNLTDYSGAKGKATVTHSLSKPCKYVQITNTATGSLWFHGVKVYVVKDESSDGITTLISRPSSSLIYDLQGRRITQPQPGQLYIMNGKKYVVK